MKNNYRIVFMGTPDFCLPALSAMVEHGYTPIAAYTQPDKINGRGKKINFSPVKSFAMSHDIPIHQPLSFKDPSEVETLKALKPDLLIVIAYGRILPKAVLDIPTYGAINVHASLLPKYRGAAPIQRVIIDGEKKTGVTIMQLDQGMDTGNIVETAQMDIPQHMTAGELFEALGEMGAKALISVLDDLPEKLANSTPQDHEKATYAEKVTKEMGAIDWTKDAKVLDALIRGMYPNPGTYTFFRGKRVKIHRAKVSEGESKEAPGTILSTKDGLTIACGKGALTISSLQPENHKRMAAGDFVNGYQVKVNDTFDC